MAIRPKKGDRVTLAGVQGAGTVTFVRRFSKFVAYDVRLDNGDIVAAMGMDMSYAKKERK